MDEYYDAHPRRFPHVPISLTGFFGSEHHLVGTQLASLTGLPHLDVGQIVAHKAGMSVSKLIERSGEPEYQRLEAESLGIALASSPPGVVVLTHGAMLDASNRRRVLRDSVLVHVNDDFDSLWTRIRAVLAERPSAYAPWIQPGALDRDAVKRLLHARRSGYDEAAIRVDAAGRTPMEIARQIIDDFQLWREESE